MSHLGMELLSAEAKMQLMHVPCKGISLALTDVIGNLQ
jgi:tripartite-type tricarboxylate transporter receptor subunit TctC